MMGTWRRSARVKSCLRGYGSLLRRALTDLTIVAPRASVKLVQVIPVQRCIIRLRATIGERLNFDPSIAAK